MFILFSILLSCLAFIFGFRAGVHSYKSWVIELVTSVDIKNTSEISKEFKEGANECKKFITYKIRTKS